VPRTLAHKTITGQVKAESESESEIVLAIGQDRITIRATSDGSPCTYIWFNQGLVAKLRNS
jgi:hypothetical protein